MDTLRGSLETFGLDGVMSLITSTGKTGVLRVFSGDLVGRIYFRDGAIVYGTTREYDGLVTDLYRRRGPGAPEGQERERRGRTQANEWTHPLPELIKHQIVDVFVRLLRMPGGQFAFEEGATTSAYQTEAEHRFEVDAIIEMARERLAEWDEISSLVPNPTVKFRLAAQLPPDQFEVTLDAKTWSFLAAVGEAAAVEDIAERLRIFEFPAAKKVAEFARQGLLVIAAEDQVAAAAPIAALDDQPEQAPAPIVDEDPPQAEDAAVPPLPSVRIETMSPPVAPVPRIKLPDPPEIPSFTSPPGESEVAPESPPPPPGTAEIEVRTMPADAEPPLDRPESDDPAAEAF